MTNLATNPWVGASGGASGLHNVPVIGTFLGHGATTQQFTSPETVNSGNQTHITNVRTKPTTNFLDK